jgi:hypothetical protein
LDGVDAWAAAIHAIGRDGDSALKNLRSYIDHCYPSSFHANGDCHANGHTKAVFGAFNVEGNSAAAAAVQEMLMHSAPCAIRLFLAMPGHSAEASFCGFLADGGIVVSAELVDASSESIEAGWRRFRKLFWVSVSRAYDRT